VTQLISDLQPERSQGHVCLGCNPCPPGDLYAAYLRQKYDMQQFVLEDNNKCCCE
jgi:hypothetical protein